jgi:hypothetical protein
VSVATVAIGVGRVSCGIKVQWFFHQMPRMGDDLPGLGLPGEEVICAIRR